MTRLGPVGIWLGTLTLEPYDVAVRVARHVEDLGFGALWLNEALGKEVFANAALHLATTDRITVATGVANLWARDATAMANGARTLEEAFPGRLALGVGISHRELVDRRGHAYGSPLAQTRQYLERMDEARYLAAEPEEPPLRLLGALGPKMLELAREHADGAHPYLVPVEHTRRARQILGPDKILAPEQGVVLDEDPDTAREVAREHLSGYRRFDNYNRSLERLGWGDNPLEEGGSDDLVDALIAWGEPARIADRVAAHHDAGADHVALQVLPVKEAIPSGEYEALAATLLG